MKTQDEKSLSYAVEAVGIDSSKKECLELAPLQSNAVIIWIDGKLSNIKYHEHQMSIQFKSQISSQSANCTKV